ncbi:MAG: ABC transporter ATP-binding protein [Tepidisphaerales bacterium]
MIEVRELTRRYGAFTAVDGVTFDVADGEIVGLLGPNGAGKSTTMKMLTCYLPPTSGGARVAGFDVVKQSADVRRQLGYLPENCPLYPDMKVEEYLDFRGRLRRMERADRKRRIAEVMDRCWLTPVRRRLIGHLSKGYRQRVGLADALLHDPKVLILDEPTVGLDPAQIRETRKLIRELGGRHTVVLSTHILPEVEATCSRVIVIAGGRVVASGTPAELRSGRGLGPAADRQRLVVELRGEAGTAEAVCRSVTGVSGVEVRAATGGCVTLHVVSNGTDVREALAEAVQRAGLRLRELRSEAMTLEEFFVAVTASQAQQRSEVVAPQSADDERSRP